MKVNQTGNKPTQSTDVSNSKQIDQSSRAQNTKKNEKVSSTESEAQPNSHTRTEISSRGKELAQAKAMAMDTPDVREDRVADLKKRIADGSYKINSSAIADRMLEEHLRLPGA